MLHIQTLTFNPFQEQTYILWNDALEAVIIDPGCYDLEEQQVLQAFITKHKLVPQVVLNTHCHIDHVLGNAFACKTWNIPLWVPAGEVEQLASVLSYGPSMGIFPEASPKPKGLLDENSELKYLGIAWQVLNIPGHSPDGLCFYLPSENMLIAGDVLFMGSIGRTDLPGGNYERLMRGITQKLMPLPDATVVYPGHGDKTSIGIERKHNPFVLDYLRASGSK
jgi:glyoxylase-like metal-dependent hydrolase (beta-lactamase superfamily II)